MATLHFYIIRHGKTVFNETGRVQGMGDSPLLPEGVEMARQAGRALKSVYFRRAYTGILTRQKQTAKLILNENEHVGTRLRESIAFNEVNYGGLEGATRDEYFVPLRKLAGAQENELFYELRARIGSRKILELTRELDPLGLSELYDEIQQRVRLGLTKMIAELQEVSSEEQNILVVTSGSALRYVLEEMLPGTTVQKMCPNLGLTTVDYEDGTWKPGMYFCDDSYMEV